MPERLVQSLLTILPKNHLSHLVGRLASIEHPPSIAQSLISWFIARYRVDISEAEHPPHAYPSLQKFFVRNLKAGLRPIGEGVVSPVDGCISEFGPIQDGRMIQAKGKYYTAEKLLGSVELGKLYSQGFFITFYLAPPDYHHIHAPVAGRIVRSIHIPGKLWPVNSMSVSTIRELFAINERVVSVIESDFGKVSVVMVGATNVGSIKLTYDNLVTNQSPRFFDTLPTEDRTYPSPITVQRGEQIGTFQMGSTVILLFENNRFVPGATVRPGKIRLGTTIL